MKIIFCGPPHSGKSVLLVNLEKLLPNDSYETVRLNRDGEGDWSNNSEQDDVKIVRVKNDYDEKFIKQKCAVVRKSKKPIVLADIGGMLYPDKMRIFKACDCFVVLSSDKTHQKEWEKFGEFLGCRCVASFLSVLNDSKDGPDKEKDSCEEENGILKGTICDLKRGSSHLESDAIAMLADKIIKESGYKEARRENQAVVNFNRIAQKIGCCNHRKVGSTDVFYNTEFKTENIPSMLHEIRNRPPRKGYKIDGARANWVAAIAAFELKRKGAKSIKLYDTNIHKFIKLKKISFGEKKEKFLDYNLIEKPSEAFIDFNPDGKELRYQNLPKMTIPRLDIRKKILVSGRIPLWLLDSILLSLENNEIYVHQPGKEKNERFICVKNENQDSLGKNASFDEIDVDEYFNSKKI